MTSAPFTRCFECEEHGSGFNIVGPAGALTYDPTRVELSADGELPPWAVASGYATDMDVALSDGGEAALWEALEAHYRAMTSP